MIARVKKRLELKAVNTEKCFSIAQPLKVNQKWKIIDKGFYAVLSRNGIKLSITKDLFGSYFEIIDGKE